MDIAAVAFSQDGKKVAVTRARANNSDVVMFSNFRQVVTGVASEEFLKHLAVGRERTLEQDPAFAFRIIVDIASKALSPAMLTDKDTIVLIETVPLEQAGEAYARMMEGKARFRMVLVTKDGVARDTTVES